ncbi:hypothetical protein AB0J43_33955 [Nonomuraea fuscirosea]
MCASISSPASSCSAVVAAALHDMAQRTVARELARLEARASLPETARTEVAATLQRITTALVHPACSRLLHVSGTPAEARYLDAVRQLFALPAVTTIGAA